MPWRNNLEEDELDLDEVVNKIVDKIEDDDLLVGGEMWWVDGTNDPREFLLSYQCGPEEEPIFAKQARVRLKIEIIEIPEEVTIVQ